MADPFMPYAEIFAGKPNGPGDARPTALQVIQDNNVANKWVGKVVLITGANSGLGLETARAMHLTGADVYITARDAAKGQAAIDAIAGSSRSTGKLGFVEMELGSLESVKKAVQAFLSKSDTLNVLINNAGIMAVEERTETEDGFEQQFGVNYLAHFVLTSLLLPTLLKSSTPVFNSRVISVTSSGHGFSSVHFDDINLTNNYSPWVGYGQSKTGNIWLANYLDRIYGPHGLHANAVHPGAIATSIGRHLSREAMDSMTLDPVMGAQFKSPEQGAATTVWAAVADIWEGKGGQYLADCGIGMPAKNTQDIADEGFAPHAFNTNGETRLWELSIKLTNINIDSL